MKRILPTLLFFCLTVGVPAIAEAPVDKEHRFAMACECIQNGNVRHAHKTMRALAKKGHPRAQTVLGMMYQEGVGTEKNLGKAEKWFTKAANQGLREAENNLGHLYLSAEKSIHNPRKAEQWLTKAAEHGVVEAEEDLGKLYMSDDFEGKDHDKAVAWLKSAATHGSLVARHTLDQLPGGYQADDFLQKQEASAKQNGTSVAQGVGNIQTSWAGYAELAKTMHEIGSTPGQ